MQDVAHAIDVLDQLRRLGITIAIDDFGTGYSSLSYLSRLPVDSLKIDRSFISSMVDIPDNMAIVSTIISLAHSLTLRVVAEGVETAETAKFIRLLRCDDMQGFYFCPPVPKDKVAGWLKNRNEPLQKPSLS
jgi:EAL domain-containing protein (putative c-di-GMP-specific phosphodiesterase class I)